MGCQIKKNIILHRAACLARHFLCLHSFRLITLYTEDRQQISQNTSNLPLWSVDDKVWLLWADCFFCLFFQSYFKITPYCWEDLNLQPLSLDTRLHSYWKSFFKSNIFIKIIFYWNFCHKLWFLGVYCIISLNIMHFRVFTSIFHYFPWLHFCSQGKGLKNDAKPQYAKTRAKKIPNTF